MFSLMPRRRTALARREYTPFEFLRREFAPLFEFPTWALSPLAEWEPEPWGLETEEREGEIVYRAELPGFEPTEVEVTVTGNTLTIRAEHTTPAEGEAKEAKERRHARLERTMILPEALELEKIEARYHNGVLEVHVPRMPAAKPRRIEVKA